MGVYNHRNAQGQELIAHELTHVMQQVVGEAGTRVIQRRVMCNVMSHRLLNDALWGKLGRVCRPLYREKLLQSVSDKCRFVRRGKLR